MAVAVALGLGALHALAPGHGKTVMAAYLISREGSARQAVALALTVAATHTAGVLLLGAVLTITEVLAPQRTVQWRLRIRTVATKDRVAVVRLDEQPWDDDEATAVRKLEEFLEGGGGPRPSDP